MPERVNHIMAPEAIARGILLGEPQAARCGEIFTPRLRVGSGGQANMPGWPECVKCQEIQHAFDRVVMARRHLAEVTAEAQALVDAAWEKAQPSREVVP